MAADDQDVMTQARKLIKQNDRLAARALLIQAARRKATKEEALELLASLADEPADRLKYLERLEKVKTEKAAVQKQLRETETRVQETNVFKKLWSKTKRPLAIIGSIITLSQILWWGVKDVMPELRAIKQMTGEWNVAVASFTNLDTDLRRSDVVLIGSIFSNRFSQELGLLSQDINLVTQVWGPQEVDRTVSGGSVEERALAADKLAAELNADLLIYGTIQQTENGYMLQPEFYIRAENYYEADELIGQHRFGGPIAILATRETLPTQVPLNIELARRSEILALVARGLSLYLVHSYQQAYDLFQQANQDELWQNPEGREAIYLFQGNAAMRLQQYELARQAYQQAILIEPEYGRGLGGLGNVYYSLALQADSNYTFAPHLPGLEQAKAFYEQALQAEIQPPSAEIPSRAAFGIGQIYLVQWFAGQDTHDLAVEQFKRVLSNYAGGENPHLQELASEAHARLGVIYRQDEQTDNAIAELQQALELSTIPSRRGLYWASLSDLYLQQGQADAAENANRQSIEQYKSAIALPVSAELRAFFWGKIGERYELLQDTAAALDAYQHAISLLPPDHADYLIYQQRLSALQP